MTKMLIIGGVAAGATAAARTRRLDETAEITVLERGPYVSYANCGLPYFISGDIQKRSKLLLQTPEGFDARYGVKVRVRTEALELDRTGKRVRVRGPEGEEWLAYDKLILAQGGSPVLPAIAGAEAPHVFRLWTVPDTDRLDTFLREAAPRTAVVVGGGFIGLEMAEAFRKRGLETTVVELLPTVMSLMDRPFGIAVQGELEANGVKVLTGAGVKAVHAQDKTVELLRRPAPARRPGPLLGRRASRASPSLVPPASPSDLPVACRSMSSCARRIRPSGPRETWSRWCSACPGSGCGCRSPARRTGKGAWRPPTPSAARCATAGRSAPAWSRSSTPPPP
ncbi:MAG: FAD-dependent oxidoreductase [Myxococcales bacterium]